MKISDVLFEVFNTDVPGKLVKRTADTFITKAWIGNREIKFTAYGNHDEWEIIFTEKTPTGGYTFKKTGSGNELQVFSFVLESLKLFIEMYSPGTITFTSDASDENRTGLYTMMSRKVKIPGYKVKITNNPGGRFDEFTIYRVD